jgi:hypothetical protein
LAKKKNRPQISRILDLLSKGLACIDHKSLEICDQCRLWQQPRKLSGLLLFGEKSFETVCFDSFILS